MSQDGLVTAQGPGRVFITAVNEGATAVRRLDVFLEIAQTTIEGIVQLDDGSTVEGAAVSLLGLSSSATTGPDGRFSISTGVPTEFLGVTVVAQILGPGLLIDSAIGLAIVADGITDAGIMTLREPLIVNLNSRSNDRGHPMRVLLEAGTHTVVPIGTSDGGIYDAWNAWGHVTGCGPGGRGCRTGWLNSYSISAPSSGVQMTVGSGDRYVSPALALANARATVFTLTDSENVSLFIDDIPLSDNLGGMSLALF